jgi:hypothetical protein
LKVGFVGQAAFFLIERFRPTVRQLHVEQPRSEIASYPSRKSNGTIASEPTESIHHQRVTALRARPANNTQAR